MTMKPIKTLMIAPGELPSVKELLPTIEAFIQAISVGVQELGKIKRKQIDKDVYIIYNATAPLSLDGNRKVGKEIICGTFYVIAMNKDIPRSLTDKEIETYTERFHEIEMFDDWDVICQYVDSLYLSRK